MYHIYHLVDDPATRINREKFRLKNFIFKNIFSVMVTGLAPHNTAEEWRWVFVCTAAVLVLSNLLFVIMASAKPAHWTTDEFSRCASSAFSHNRIHPATLSVQHAAKDMA